MSTAAAAHGAARYLLQLYVTGTTSQSARAIANIRKICEEHLEGRYDLEIVDIPNIRRWRKASRSLPRRR